jgi:hypothetical protein
MSRADDDACKYHIERNSSVKSRETRGNAQSNALLSCPAKKSLPLQQGGEIYDVAGGCRRTKMYRVRAPSPKLVVWSSLTGDRDSAYVLNPLRC